MNFTRRLALIVGMTITAAIVSGDLQAQELTDANYAKWRDHVLPRTWELSYRKIPWRPSY